MTKEVNREVATKPQIPRPLNARVAQISSLSPDFMRRVVTIITHYVNAQFRSLLLFSKTLILCGILAVYSLANAQEAAVEDENSPPTNSLGNPHFAPHFLIDQRAWLVGRTYPAGAQAYYTVGANYLVWGDSSNWKYGYFRAAFNGASSVVINRVGVEFQFFPISIFGVSAGYDWGFRSIQPKFADCHTYECMGRVDRAFVKAQLLAAYKSLIFVGNFRFDELHHVSNRAMFFDEITLLPCNSNEERVVFYNPSLLYSINDRVKVGATSVLSHGITSNTISHMYGPVAQYAFNQKANMAFGIGQNHSTVVHSALTAFFLLSYTIDPSLAVIDLALRNNR